MLNIIMNIYHELLRLAYCISSPNSNQVIYKQIVQAIQGVLTRKM